MNKVRVFFATVVAVSTAIGGCASMNQQLTTSHPIQLSARKPILTSLPETKATQEKGGLTLVVEPVLYGTRIDSTIRDAPRKPALLEPLAWGDNAYFFTRHVTPTVSVSPDRLTFNVRLINGLNHVVRGAGTVVSAVVDGKQVALTQAGYSDLINAMVIPRGEVSLNILGPSISSLPDSCTFGLFLYDFVTATDAAGNPTERQSFEWYYKITSSHESMSGQSYTVKMVRDSKGEHTAKK